MKIRRSILKEKLFSLHCGLHKHPSMLKCFTHCFNDYLLRKNWHRNSELWREGRTTKPQYLHLKMEKKNKSFVFTLVRFGQPIKTTVFGLSFYIVCQQLWVGISALQRIRERFNMIYYHVHDLSCQFACYLNIVSISLCFQMYRNCLFYGMLTFPSSYLFLMRNKEEKWMHVLM